MSQEYSAGETPRNMNNLNAPARNMKIKFRMLLASLGLSLIVATVFATLYFNNQAKSGTANATASTATGISPADDVADYSIDGHFLVAQPTKSFSSNGLNLVVPKKSLGQSFIVHAILNKGSYHELDVENKLYAMNRMPAETTDRIIFHFEVAENELGLKYVREQYKMRTSDKQMEEALREGAWLGHEAILPIVKEDEEAYVIDAAELAQNGFFVMQMGQTEYEIVTSEVMSFKENVNVVVNYRFPGGYISAGTDKQTAEQHSMFFTMAKLPEVPMTSRAFDDRIGYFHTSYEDLGVHGAFDSSKDGEYSRQSLKVDTKHQIISRRRVEVDENGNVIKPITFYIDPTVPKMWRKYFVAGVNTWKKAYEAAGLKDAIRAVTPDDADWPEDYHVGDLRYSSITFASASANSALAIGPSVVDARSGEILGSDIVFSSTWAGIWLSNIEKDTPYIPTSGDFSKNVTNKPNPAIFHHRSACQLEREDKLIHNILLGRMLGELKGAHISEEIIGAGFADVTAHEVGHTLGLRHNFAASLARTPKELKNLEQSVQDFGLTSSYMDYTPINVWSDMTQEQINNNIWFQHKVGEYDVAAIKYGYSIIADEVSGKKHPKLYEMADEAPMFGTDDDRYGGSGPYYAAYDLSSDPQFYFKDQIDMMKNIRGQLINRGVEYDESWTRLWALEYRFLRIIRGSMGDLGGYIGGARFYHSHRSAKHPEMPDFQLATAQEQTDAIKTMLSVALGEDGVFPSPDTWHMYVEREDEYAVVQADIGSVIESVKEAAVDSILSVAGLTNVAKRGPLATLTIEEILTMTFNTLFSASGDEHELIQSYAIKRLYALKAEVEDARVVAALTKFIESIA